MDKILVDACTPLLDHFNKRPKDGLWTDIIMRMRGVHFVAYLTEGARLKTRDETLGERVAMDLLGSIMGSMDKPPTPSERERKMQKGELVVRTPLRTVVRLWDCVR